MRSRRSASVNQNKAPAAVPELGAAAGLFYEVICFEKRHAPLADLDTFSKTRTVLNAFLTVAYKPPSPCGRQAMRRAMQRFCRGERRTQHGKALAFSCILHSRRVQRHVRTVQAAFSAAPCTPPAKISSKSAVSSGVGCTRSSAKLSVFSKPRYFSPISKSAVKNSSAESFSQQRRKYSLSSSFSCFSANNSKSHTVRMPHPPCRKCFKLWHKRYKNVSFAPSV